MKKIILILGIIFLLIGVSILPGISGSFKQVKNYEVLKLLNKKPEELEIIVDQAVDSKCGYYMGGAQINCSMPLGQSFMPLYECHYGIELYIRDFNPQCPLAPIQISLKENNISGPIVPGTNVTLNLTSGDGWRYFEFSSHVNLTINQTYIIDISSTTKRWGIRLTYGYCYTRGIYYHLGVPDPPEDLYFRTYVLSPYPVANFTYSTEEPHVLFNGSSSYDPDGEIVSYEWDFGDGTTGTDEITYHKYCDIGTYDVKLTVTDDDGLKGNITKSIDVILANEPPLTPSIDGPNSGKTGIEYEYVFYVIDPDGDDFHLHVDWGDGDSSGWVGPYHSGEPVKYSHIWNESGTYIIKAKLRDFCDEGPEAIYNVKMPRNKSVSSSPFLRFLERYPFLQTLLMQLGLQ